jgi:hypothetical protein
MTSMQDIENTIGENDWLRQSFDAGCSVLAGADFA